MFRRSSEQVLKDFESRENDHPFRCCICNQMQKAGSIGVWVSQSSGFFRGTDTYTSLVNGGKDSSRSAACIDCLRTPQ